MQKIFFYIIIFFTTITFSQENFTRKDSLQGGLRLERTCYNVLKYNLNITINPDKKFIFGSNTISFNMIQKSNKLQIDLFENMKIDSIIWNKKSLSYKREFNAVFIDFPIQNSQMVMQQDITIYYQGNPIIAKNAPWDGGFVFSKDAQGKPHIGVAVQGTGASLWYPCKDSQTDEPDYGAFIGITVPKGLIAVCNGQLISKYIDKINTDTFYWEVKNPINNYDITLNIADYAYFGENYKEIQLDYYVLKENLEKAKVQFEQVKPMLDCFQSKFGEYPFKEDGYKLVETPYLGMEHQSCVAYGNKYQNGYLGGDLSNTGIGMGFDYIIIHESGHEWFGNSITSTDIADMWIHEGFTQYSELVYIECTKGYENAMIYGKGLQFNVRNDKPIIGNYGVNNEGSGDMYPKGALLLNTLRHVINDDALWWELMLEYSTTFKHQIIDTETVISFFNNKSKLNLDSIFNQYLRYTNIPKLEIKKKNKKFEYKWITDVSNFNMPIDVKINDKKIRLEPTNDWKKSKIKIKSLDEIDVLTEGFFIKVSKIN